MRSRKRLFTRDQRKRIANIFDNIGQVVLAAIVIPTLLGIEIDAVEPRVLLWSGVLISVASWWISLRIERISS